MYHDILINAGYAVHGQAINGIRCWIKAHCPDINVDNISGFWATENATDDRGYGNTAESLAAYLAA